MTLQIELSSLGNDKDDVSKDRREVIEAEIKEIKSQAQELDSKWRQERNKTEEIKKIREDLEKLRFELEEKQRVGDYQRASELQYSIIPALEKQLPVEADEDVRGDSGDRVTSDDVARVVAKVRLEFRLVRYLYSPNILQATGIPVSTLVRGDRTRLLSLESILRRRVVGQEAALTSVSEAVRLSRAGLHSPTRPVACFLFLGPTGVGKTELAKALASELTGTERNLVTINMR